MPEEKVRIRGQITGGGFGGKEDIACQIYAALLAQATGKPVKIALHPQGKFARAPETARNSNSCQVRCSTERITRGS